MARPAPTATHDTAVCAYDPRTNRYSFRNWSALFACPACGRRRRQNFNYLGSRRSLACTGDRWTYIERTGALPTVTLNNPFGES